MKKEKYAIPQQVAPVAEQLEQAAHQLQKIRTPLVEELTTLVRALLADTRAVAEIEKLRLERLQADRVERWDRYFDVVKYLRRAARMASISQAANHTGSTLLDVGCGPAFFGYAVHQLYQIRAIGLDLPASERSISWRIASALGQTIQPHRLEPLRPLPDLGQSFDLVTIISPQFYRKNPEEFWNEAEWQDLFQQIFSLYLKPGGKLVMHINFKKKQGDGLYDHSDLMTAIAKIPESRVENDWMWLPRPAGIGVRPRVPGSVRMAL